MVGIQFAGLVSTIAISIVGGLLTGLLIKIPLISTMDPNEYFDDKKDWEIDNRILSDNDNSESPVSV